MAKWSKALSSWPIDCRFEPCLGILHFFPIFPNFRVPPGVSGTSRVRGNLPIITYGFRSTTTYGLSLRIPAYSWCHFHIENSNFRALKIMFFRVFYLKSLWNQFSYNWGTLIYLLIPIRSKKIKIWLWISSSLGATVLERDVDDILRGVKWDDFA